MTITPYRPMRSHPKMVHGLECLIKMLPDGITGIEIGSYAGESAEIFARSGKFKKLYCVDLWSPTYYSGQQLISAEKQFDLIASKYSIISKQKMDCNSVLGIFDDVSFVYIDGNHNREQFMRDIQNSRQILDRQPGTKILAGHDYDYAKSPDIRPVIREMLGYPDAIFCDYSWIKFL